MFRYKSVTFALATTESAIREVRCGDGSSPAERGASSDAVIIATARDVGGRLLGSAALRFSPPKGEPGAVELCWLRAVAPMDHRAAATSEAPAEDWLNSLRLGLLHLLGQASGYVGVDRWRLRADSPLVTVLETLDVSLRRPEGGAGSDWLFMECPAKGGGDTSFIERLRRLCGRWERSFVPPPGGEPSESVIFV